MRKEGNFLRRISLSRELIVSVGTMIGVFFVELFLNLNTVSFYSLNGMKSLYFSAYYYGIDWSDIISESSFSLLGSFLHYFSFLFSFGDPMAVLRNVMLLIVFFRALSAFFATWTAIKYCKLPASLSALCGIISAMIIPERLSVSNLPIISVLLWMLVEIFIKYNLSTRKNRKSMYVSIAMIVSFLIVALDVRMIVVPTAILLMIIIEAIIRKGNFKEVACAVYTYEICFFLLFILERIILRVVIPGADYYSITGTSFWYSDVIARGISCLGSLIGLQAYLAYYATVTWAIYLVTLCMIPIVAGFSIKKFFKRDFHHILVSSDFFLFLSLALFILLLGVSRVNGMTGFIENGTIPSTYVFDIRTLSVFLGPIILSILVSFQKGYKIPKKAYFISLASFVVFSLLVLFTVFTKFKEKKAHNIYKLFDFVPGEVRKALAIDSFWKVVCVWAFVLVLFSVISLVLWFKIKKETVVYIFAIFVIMGFDLLFFSKDFSGYNSMNKMNKIDDFYDFVYDYDDLIDELDQIYYVGTKEEKCLLKFLIPEFDFDSGFPTHDQDNFVIYVEDSSHILYSAINTDDCMVCKIETRNGAEKFMIKGEENIEIFESYGFELIEVNR